jgi:hypothetical protein
MNAQARHYHAIGGLDWWKRDGHPTHGETAQAAGAACGCNEKRSEKEESR